MAQMNKQIENFARSELKRQLSLLPEKNQALFKRMYSHKNPELDIESVVDLMPADKLDWAMTQVERTPKK